MGAGAEVAPTKKAQLYELARHELTPERGAVSRAELDRVAWDTLQWLERAFQERSTVLSYLRIDPRIALVRARPEYLNLVRQLSGE